jgi:hypothetical protein
VKEGKITVKKRIYCLILLEIIIVLILTVAWEFWLEDVTYAFIRVDHEPEDLAERVEYIITSSVFVLIALIVPLWIIIRDVSKLERTTAELQKAMDNIKTLEGLLPICASCKNIRNDNGYWQKVEVYIREHSKAKFSHSICPECAHQLYPDLFNEAKTEKPNNT